MESAGYGRKHRHPMIVLLDGHTSRWTHHGLQVLIKHAFFPFCIGSHTSAWDQPNDCGPNAIMKCQLGKIIHLWRVENPFSIFDRTAFNKCLVKTIHEMTLRLASDLAGWKAKMAAWTAAGDDVSPLVGKPGNTITRAFANTGWCPLKRESRNWSQVIPTLGARAKPGLNQLHTKCAPDVFAKLGRGLKIRQLTLDGYNENFLNITHSL